MMGLSRAQILRKSCCPPAYLSPPSRHPLLPLLLNSYKGRPKRRPPKGSAYWGAFNANKLHATSCSEGKEKKRLFSRKGLYILPAPTSFQNLNLIFPRNTKDEIIRWDQGLWWDRVTSNSNAEGKNRKVGRRIDSNHKTIREEEGKWKSGSAAVPVSHEGSILSSRGRFS